MYHDRNYCIFSTDELDTIDFSQVHETSADTVRRSVDGCLACILGREAADRGVELTMEQILQENRKLEVNLEGLKA